jgi:hypothetical protein
MALLPAVILFGFVLENDNFLVFALPKHIGFYGRSFYHRSTNLQPVVIAQGKDFIEFYRGTFRSIQLFYPEDISLLDPVLLSAGLDNSIHL